MDLQRHRVWTAYYNDIQLSEFCERVVPKIIFKHEVHLDVIKTFDVIKKLLVHSYFEYEFVDIALSRTLQAFEMALRLRYREITNSEWNGKRPLKQLIDWFERDKYFEVLNPRFLEHIRNLRNYFSHPAEHRLAGYATIPWIDTVVDLINDLYEDRNLRSERKDLNRKLTDQLKRITEQGAIIEGNGLSELIYNAQIAFVDNKSKPAKIFVLVNPIFTIVKDQVTKPPFLIEVLEPNFLANNDSIKMNAPSEIGIRPLKTEKEISDFNYWLNESRKNPEIAMRIPIFDNRAFVALRRNFHFQ